MLTFFARLGAAWRQMPLRALRSIRRVFQLSTLQLFVWSGGSKQRIGRQIPYDLGYSGVVPSPLGSELWSRLSQDWADADVLWRTGFYRRSVEQRADILRRAYDAHGLDPADHTPPFLSPGYSSNVGHIGFIALLGIARQMGSISADPRRILLGSQVGNQQLLQGLEDSFDSVSLRQVGSLMDLPAAWVLSERLQMVNAKGQFIDSWALWEETMQALGTSDFRHLSGYRTPSTIGAKAARFLQSRGLEAADWFVALHIRTQEYPRDPRSVLSETYVPSVERVLEAGGFVVRFGTRDETPLSRSPRYIDLSDSGGVYRWLDGYLMERCRFFVSTESGPSVMASAMGTDVLKTNAIGIGRNTLSATPRTRYLPKHVKVGRHAEEVGLEEIACSPVGYSDPATRWSLGSGFYFEDNSAEELEAAVVEMLTLTSGSPVYDSALGRADERVNDIRKRCGALSYGRISATYLESNPQWLA